MASQPDPRADLYATLAEVLSEPPAWLALAGRDWPLFKAVVRLASSGSLAARRAVEGLASIGPASLQARQRRYQGLFAGSGRPRLWLYESLYVDGRLLGPSTFAVQQVYRAAGLEPQGAELADHASLELTFLGWLVEEQAAHPDQAADWRRVSQHFIERHAGRWLPDLGRALSSSGDALYAPIGQLLVDWLAEAIQSSHSQACTETQLPLIPQAEACTLCGFCVQVCPTRALLVCEIDVETTLLLSPKLCVGCAKCEQVCEFDALSLEAGPADEAGPIVLRLSPRALCPHCGQPTVSRAELEAIAARIGDWPPWLNYCLECRPMLIGQKIPFRL